MYIPKITHPQISQRAESNKQIINLLDQFFKENPTIRFIQALHALSIIETDDKFYEESTLTIKKLRECLHYLA